MNFEDLDIGMEIFIELPSESVYPEYYRGFAKVIDSSLDMFRGNSITVEYIQSRTIFLLQKSDYIKNWKAFLSEGQENTKKIN